MKTATTLAALFVAISATTAAAVEIWQPFTIPGDAGVVYYITKAVPVKGNVIRAITKRDSTALGCDDCGVSWTEREVDCKKGTFRYTAEADTRYALDENRKVHPKDKMGPIVDGSIASYIAGESCSIAGKLKK
jgi:hypothetical protein